MYLEDETEENEPCLTIRETDDIARLVCNEARTSLGVY